MPVVVDTGAEVSVVPLSVLQTVSPHKSLPTETREVRSLDGALVSIKEPLSLRIQVCNVTLEHSFLANVNSRSRSLYAVARPSVCLSSVCL